MADNDVVVRKAVKEDCEHILSMIKELAEYEDMLEFVEMTVARLEADGFPADGPANFTCHVLDRAGTLLGIAFHVFSYCTWTGRILYLEDLYVTPACRGRGLGRRLLASVARWGVDAGCAGLDFSVLASDAPAKAFYKRIGTDNLSETKGWEMCRISGPALAALAAEAEK